MKKREVTLLDWKDYELNIVERIVLGKYRNQISLYDVRIVYLPLNIVGIGQRYESPVEMSHSERISDMCERANESVKRQYRKQTGKALQFDDEWFNDKYHDLLEDDDVVKPSYFSYKDYLWDKMFILVGKYSYEKVVEDFVTRDKVLNLASKMKLSYEDGTINKESYNAFKKLLVESGMLESSEI